MKYFLVLAVMMNLLFGAKVYHKEWQDGQTFSQYLKVNNISAAFLESISKETQILT